MATEDSLPDSAIMETNSGDTTETEASELPPRIVTTKAKAAALSAKVPTGGAATTSSEPRILSSAVASVPPKAFPQAATAKTPGTAPPVTKPAPTPTTEVRNTVVQASSGDTAQAPTETAKAPAPAASQVATKTDATTTTAPPPAQVPVAGTSQVKPATQARVPTATIPSQQSQAKPLSTSLPPARPKNSQPRQPHFSLQHHQQQQHQQQPYSVIPIQPPPHGVFYSNGVAYVMQPVPVHPHPPPHMMHPHPHTGVQQHPVPPPMVPYPPPQHPPPYQQRQHIQQQQQQQQQPPPPQQQQKQPSVQLEKAHQQALKPRDPQQVQVKHHAIPLVQAQQQGRIALPTGKTQSAKSGDDKKSDKKKPAPFKPMLRLVEPEEKDSMFQPLAVQRDSTYYLHNDEILVEEDPLPPRNRYAEALAKRAVLPSASSLQAHPVLPRSVGGIQDQVHMTPASCNCKNKKSSRRGKTGHACLMKYCDCFATGSYCNQHCRCEASCYNNAAEANVKPRTQAIVETLRSDPQAFRQIHYTTAEQQKEHRSRLAKIMEARKPIAAGSEDDPLTNKPPKEVLTLQLPPSYYTAPLKIHDDSTILTGLSFSLTHPRNRKRKSSGGSGGVGKKHLYHNLMLSPSKNLHKENESDSAAADDGKMCTENASTDQRTGPTEVEVFWQNQTKRLDAVFDLVRSEIKPSTPSKTTKKNSANSSLLLEAKKVASTFVPQLKEDMEGLKAVATAAKGDILARFFKENRLKQVGAGSLGVAYRYGAPDQETAEQLECREELPSLQPTTDSATAEEAKLRELTIFAAQDTAVLQETARMIRKTARELCERRVQRKDM